MKSNAAGLHGLAPLLFAVGMLGMTASGQGVVSSYGSSCGVSGGPVLSFSGSPEPGAAFTFSATNLHLVSAAYLIVGFSDVNSAYGPLPLLLSSPPFVAGCELLTSDELVLPIPTAGGAASFAGAFPLGVDGYRFFAQVLLVGPSVWQSSNGIDVLVLSPSSGIGAVEGSVTLDATGAAAPGARVTLFTPSLSYFAETRAGPTGIFTFPTVPTGGYRLGVALEDNEYAEAMVTVAGGAPTVVNFALTPETHPGSWSVIGSTAPEFLDATDIGVLRPDGTIFYCHDTTDPIVFDPTTGLNSFPPSSGSPQGCMNATHLNDGSVLLFGGQNGSSPGNFTNAISWVKRFRNDDTWEVLGNMLAPTGRWYPGLARLNDGRPFVFGGGTAPAAVRTDTAEIFDQTTQIWTPAATMSSANEFAPAGLLYNGLVLRSWGAAPETYDPATNQWSATGGFVSPVRGYPGHSDHSLLVLSNGDALAIGVSRLNQPAASMTEFFDPAAGIWSAGTSPDLVRMQGEVVYLPDGRVFYGAGDQEAINGPEPDVLGIVRRCDLFDPVPRTWRRVADMLAFREYHAVSLLVPDGRVVTTGGTRIKFAVGPSTADIEAYSPPYLSRGVRPRMSGLTDSTPARGQTVSVNVFPQTMLTGFVLMGLQSHTHWVDGGIPRRLELAATQSGTVAQLTLPTDADLLPLGWYMLFAMVDDIPSKALVVRIDP